MHFSEKKCIIAFFINEILQFWIIINDIVLFMCINANAWLPPKERILGYRKHNFLGFFIILIKKVIQTCWKLSWLFVPKVITLPE